MFTTVSWYTKNTEYESVIMDYLVPSLLKLNLSHKIYPMDSLNNWRKNTNLKPVVIEKAFSDINTDLLVVDADAVIHHYPKLLDEIPEEYDCAIFWLKWREWYNYPDNNTEQLASGTLFFRNRNICKQLIKQWQEQCKTNNITDQKALEIALRQFPNLKIYKLPYEYCWINSLPGGKIPYVKKPKQVVIEHWQISRDIRNGIK